MSDDKTGFTLEQCRQMAQEAIDARASGSLVPIAEFDPERILWLIEQAARPTPTAKEGE